MPLPNQRARVTLFCGGRGGKEAEMVAWYRPSGGPATMTAAGYASAFAAGIATAFAAPLKACLPTDAAYVGLSLLLWDSGTTYRAKDRTGAGPGTVASDCTPYEAAVLLTKSTGAPGRPGHGRWFVPFVPETFTDDEFLVNPTPAAYAVLGATFLNQVSDPNAMLWDACHYSRHDTTIIPIVDVQIDPHLAMQQRRRLQLLFT